VPPPPSGRLPARVALLAAVAALATACAATEPAPGPTLDISASANPYFEQVRKQIRTRWSYPCLTDPTTGACEYMNAQVTLEFGIREDGSLAFVDVTQSSGYAVYDTQAADAVRRAAPFPPVPADVMASRPARGTGIPVRAHFNYVSEPKQ
jgi:protein TonB